MHNSRDHQCRGTAAYLPILLKSVWPLWANDEFLPRCQGNPPQAPLWLPLIEELRALRQIRQSTLQSQVRQVIFAQGQTVPVITANTKMDLENRSRLISRYVFFSFVTIRNGTRRIRSSCRGRGEKEKGERGVEGRGGRITVNNRSTDHGAVGNLGLQYFVHPLGIEGKQMEGHITGMWTDWVLQHIGHPAWR